MSRSSSSEDIPLKETNPGAQGKSGGGYKKKMGPAVGKAKGNAVKGCKIKMSK